MLKKPELTLSRCIIEHSPHLAIDERDLLAFWRTTRRGKPYWTEVPIDVTGSSQVTVSSKSEY